MGVAVSDEMGMLARGVETLPGDNPVALRDGIARLARAYDVDRILVGLPRRMDGSEGTSAQAARELADLCASTTGLPVILWDERLTTKGAEKLLIQSNVSRRRRREIIDQSAARWILQSYLDRRSGPSS